MHTTKVCPPLPPPPPRITAAATLNPAASRPPLMHLHTEDRPNKVINQRPIFKWFAGRLKPLHTPPRVNSPTCCGARYPFSSADTATTGHRDINIYIPLHCIAEGRTTPIYQYTYAYISYALGKLTASVIRLCFHDTRRSQLIPGEGDNLNIALECRSLDTTSTNSLCLINNEIAVNMEIQVIS